MAQQAFEELGQALHKAKKVAPTRPHPHIPDQPLGEAVLGAVYDRLRDRIQGRPRT